MSTVNKILSKACEAADDSTMASKHGAVVFMNKKRVYSDGHNTTRTRTLRHACSSEHAEVAAIRKAYNTLRGEGEQCLQGEVASCC